MKRTGTVTMNQDLLNAHCKVCSVRLQSCQGHKKRDYSVKGKAKVKVVPVLT